MTTPVIILVRPQLPSNIGSVARVIKNFGCSELRIVNPRESFINDDSIAIAAGAGDVLQNAKVYDQLSEAIADLEQVYAFTARKRYANKTLLNLTEITVEQINAQKIGLMFGAENSGLSNHEIAFANKQLFITANPNFSSLNISHAVAVALHHFYALNANLPENIVKQELAKLGELNDFLVQLEQDLLKTNFLKLPEKRPLMLINIKNIFTRVEGLTSQEVRTLRGILTALSNKN